jgi:hypothetical protein
LLLDPKIHVEPGESMFTNVSSDLAACQVRYSGLGHFQPYRRGGLRQTFPLNELSQRPHHLGTDAQIPS